MKKLLILVLSAAMILALSTVSIAAITMSGEVVTKYDFISGSDAAEGKIEFDGKVNDAVTAKIIYKFDGGDNVFVDEYWLNVTGDAGELKVGKFGYGTKGDVDIVNGTYDDFKAESGVSYTYNAELFTFKAFWAPDQSDITSAALFTDGLFPVFGIGDNAFVLTLAYGNEIWGADINYLNSGTLETGLRYEGYAINLWVQPVESLKLYGHYGTIDTNDTLIMVADKDREAIVLGALYTAMDGALTIRGEYGTYEEDPFYFSVGGGPPTLIDLFDNKSWGVAIQYAASNGITYKYTRKHKDYDNDLVPIDGILTSEFKVTVSF